MRWALYLLLFPLSLMANRSALYLSWYDDPSTTMTIQWHTESQDASDLLFWKASDSDAWQETAPTRISIPCVDVNRVMLSDLDDGAEYEFRIGADPTIFRFRTMPKVLNAPLKFAIGSDLFQSRKIFRKMAQTIRSHDPDFIVLGGNLAHAIHSGFFQLPSSGLKRWLSFLEEWKNNLITDEGRVIPFLVVPGEEDIATDDYQLFFSLFGFPEHQLFRTIDFGNYLSLFLLDTGHFHPIDGPQAYWLKKSLSERQKRPFRFAIYHESAYPSFDSYLGETPKKIRTYWCPLFERYGLQAAFEHHNLAFKRTFPIKAGKVNSSGVLYLGDGCWGAEPQPPTQDRWYLEKKEKRNGVWLIQLTPEKATIRAIDLFDETIDELSLPATH